ncbi:MAG TPA: SirB2 family protein [Gallionella sp.]|nr:SirB2 family protein [Gallionella sp.]
MSFMLIKHFHISCAVLSYTLFFLRGIWGFNDSSIMRQRWIKVVPHVVDTLLLASALTLAFTIQQYPFVDSWLTAKVFGLLLYIGLGFVALKYGKSKTTRVSAWLAAQAVFAYIVMVAVKHNPLPFIH